MKILEYITDGRKFRFYINLSLSFANIFAMLLQVQNCINLQKLTSFANVWVASGLLKYCPTYIVVEV